MLYTSLVLNTNQLEIIPKAFGIAPWRNSYTYRTIELLIYNLSD